MKKVLITGVSGYIGSVLSAVLHAEGYEVIGLDCNYYEGCLVPSCSMPTVTLIKKDIRDIAIQDLEGIYAVIHLSALSNDPLSEMNPQLTDSINAQASYTLAQLAKQAGVERFIFSSSCSVYGIATDSNPITETHGINPLTAYAQAKAKVEKDIAPLASDTFHPIFMRNATVYGMSPMLRLDLVVNNLVAAAFTTGKISILSDGTPWRPLIHVRDLSNAFSAMLKAPVSRIHNQTFNVGRINENYQVKEIADEVQRNVPDCTVEILRQTGGDDRSYRVDFSRINSMLSDFTPQYDIKKGIIELYHAYKEMGLTLEDFKGKQYFRIRWLKHLMQTNQVSDELRMQSVPR